MTFLPMENVFELKKTAEFNLCRIMVFQHAESGTNLYTMFDETEDVFVFQRVTFDVAVTKAQAYFNQKWEEKDQDQERF